MIIQRGFRLHAASGLFRGRMIELFLTLFKDDNREYLLKPNEDGGWEEPLELTTNAGYNLPASFRLLPEAAQKLFDDLYAQGFRPTARTDDPEAINQHLQDMRTIAFAKLNIPQPTK
jgi:hypothetical protein